LEEAVDHAGVAAQLDVDARWPEAVDVGLALVAEGVAFGGHDRGWQGGPVGLEER
jgi:hypothetical protein